MNRYQRHQLIGLPKEVNDIVEKYYVPNKFKQNTHRGIIDVYDNGAISMFGEHDYSYKFRAKFFNKRFTIPIGGIISQIMPRVKPHEVDLRYIGKSSQEYYRKSGHYDCNLRHLFKKYPDKYNVYSILKYCVLNS